MVSAMVMVKDPGRDNWEGLGSHDFLVLPRVDERIDLDVSGVGYSYKVVAVHHPLDPADAAGDIYAVRLGTIPDVVKRLFEESPDAG